MKLVHLTDTHLDHVEEDDLLRYYDDIAEQYRDAGVDAFIHSGDISNAIYVTEHIANLSNALPAPLYFVLGNHDYYYDRVSNVRNIVKKLFTTAKSKYLTMSGPIYTGDVAIVGHDCWYDARIGNVYGGFALNDWRFIHDFIPHLLPGRIEPNDAIINTARCLADEGTFHIEQNIKKALSAGIKKIVVVSHPPPFAEAHTHDGERGHNSAMPWYTCHSLGLLLNEVALSNPRVEFLTLHGHTHGFFEKRLMSNLTTKVGASTYGSPGAGSVFEF